MEQPLCVQHTLPGAIEVKERRANIDVHHESGFVGERVYGGSTHVLVLARGDEAGEREATERNRTFTHGKEQMKRCGLVAAPDAAGDGSVPGGRGALRHCVEQVEGGGC